MEKEEVVKCSQCGKYFGHSEKNTKCPFCKTAYGKAEGKSEEKFKEKKETSQTQKKTFKIWKE